jgi:hypothetical protein
MKKLNAALFDILWLACLYSLYFIQMYFLTVGTIQPGHSTPLHGYIGHQDLHKQQPKYDSRCPIHKGKVEFTHTRGFMGILFNPSTASIDFIYPESNLHKLGIEAGDFILEINHERIRPCIMPNVSFYPSGSFIDLTVNHNGVIKHISVQLINSHNFTSQ